MMCCRERMEPYEAPKSYVIVSLVLWAGASVGIFGLGSSVHEISLSLHASMNWHLCTAMQLSSEAVGGSSIFLGTAPGLERLHDISAALDVDGDSIRTLRRVLDSTSDFASRHRALRRRVVHFGDVLRRFGPGFRAFEHRCVFCSLAVGDPDNIVPGFRQEGLVPALLSEIGSSSSEAMNLIRESARERLTGDNLTALARGIKRATGSMEALHTAFQGLLIDNWPRKLPSVDATETIRIGIALLLGISAMAGGIIGWLAFLVTYLRMRNRPDLIPSGKPHCCTWCCGFCYATGALLLGGGLLGLSVFAGEACTFTRHDLLVSDGLNRYAPVLGLLPRAAGGSAPGEAARALEAELAIGLMRTCLTAEGSGNMLDVLELRDLIAFEPSLTSSFYKLDNFAASNAVGRDTAEILVELRGVAAEFGKVFVLDPLPAAVNGSIGMVELSPNTRDLLLGSGISSNDTKNPDGYTTIRGLNSYAELVAGPGKYKFLHGTAGGGFLITPNRPTDAEMETLPSYVRNALLYGRAKERLLASIDSLSCDRMDGEGLVTERFCSVNEFQQYVSAEVALIKVEASACATEAEAVESLFRNDLKINLLPPLRKLRDIRTSMNCRVLWRRFEDLDSSLCDDLAPTAARGAVQLLALAAVSSMGILVHYKVWRHLKDNKVLKHEVERFEKRLKKFEKQMGKLNQHRHDLKLKAGHHTEDVDYDDFDEQMERALELQAEGKA